MRAFAARALAGLLVCGSLLAGAAATATRPKHVPQGRFHVDE